MAKSLVVRLLLCDRQESRPMEAVARFLRRPLAAVSHQVDHNVSMAKAVINCAVIKSDEKAETCDIEVIFR